MFFKNIYELVIKFAALSDEQYKAVLRNPEMLQLLDKTNRLDDFYRSMPNNSLEEIEEQIKRVYEGIAAQNKKEIPEEFSSFLKINGERPLPAPLVAQVKSKIMEEDEGYGEYEAGYYSNYIEKATFEKLFSDYVKSPYFDKTKLSDFMYFYDKYIEISRKGEELTNDDRNLLGLLNRKLVGMLVTFLKAISASEVMEHGVVKKLTQAKRIRKSDEFDFLLGGKITPIEEETKYTLVDNPKRFDYRDEPTKK